MIASLRDEPSHEDELASKAIPATMYIGTISSFDALFDTDEIVASGGADTVSSHIFSGI
jgi:hypothetical protein